jgi:peptidoglycan/xylan/chitin deacetylase (PgdA/CDA1 family)
MESIPLNQSVKRFIRIFIAHLLYYTGFLNLLLWIKLRNKAVVLMYHRVLDKDEISKSYSQNGIIVSKKTFAAQMQYLNKHFNMISLTDVIERVKDKIPFVSKSCLITFDDGWKDNFQNAYPVLKKNRIPAAIFLPTDFIGTNRNFWQERLTKLLMYLHLRCRQNKDLKEKAKHNLNTVGIAEILSAPTNKRYEEISKFVSLQKNKTKPDIENLIKEIESLVELPAPDDDIEDSAFLDWSKIKSMLGNGIEFGSHGKSHTILTSTDVDLDSELMQSKSVVESQLNTPIRSFSYPNGDYAMKIADQVRQYGYNIAFGTEYGFVTHLDNPYTLKRINIHEDMTNNIPMFLARIAGLW